MRSTGCRIAVDDDECEGRDMINPELRKHLPALPGRKDDIVTRLGLLFVEAYEEIARMRNIIEVSKDANIEEQGVDVGGLMTQYMRIIGNYVEAQGEYIENMPMRYLSIIKEYQEMLFAQPEEPEEISQDELKAEYNILHPGVSHDEFLKERQEVGQK